MSVTGTAFAEMIQRIGVSVVCGVPCSLLKHAISALEEQPAVQYINAANEGPALGIAAGAAIAGRRTATLMQDSGFGNIINPLTSLSMPFGIGGLLIIGSHNGATDEPQHKAMAPLVTDVLTTLSIPYFHLTAETMSLEDLAGELESCLAASQVVALLVGRGAIESDSKRPQPPRAATRDHGACDTRLSYEDALQTITTKLPLQTAFVATTGYISRELYKMEPLRPNFYMTGSMGHAAAIALGVAQARDGSKPIAILDGDGALLMHMGVMSTIGALQPHRFVHIVLDNGVYESTGGQSSTAESTSFPSAALACGYAKASSCRTPEDLSSALAEAIEAPAPHMVVIKVASDPDHIPPSVMAQRMPRDIATRFAEALMTTN